MINRIRIQNFRSLLDVTVELDPLTVLIGRSGTGKSNFVHAIRYLRTLLKNRQIVDPRPVFNNRHAATALAYTVDLSVPGLSAPMEYRLEISTQRGMSESFRVGERTVFSHAAGKWIVPPPNNMPIEPNKVQLGATPGVHESTVAYLALCNGVGCYDFPGSVLQEKTQDAGTGEVGFGDAGRNHLTTVEKLVTDLTKIESWDRIRRAIKVVNPAAGDLTTSVPQVHSISVGYQIGNKIVPLDAREESEGFRRFLANLIALYQSPPKQTLFFEHPETGLHPGALEALAREFKQCPDEGRGQVVLITHSPQLLDYFPAEAIRVVDIHEQVTRIERLSPEQLDAVHGNLLFAGELLTVDPARPAKSGSDTPQEVPG